MSELRWTLLILGVVFIAALSWWERRRPRQAFAPRLREASLSHGDPRRTASPERATGAEPWIGDTDLSDTVVSDVALNDAAESAVPAGEDGLRSRIEPLRPSPLEELPTLIIPDADERLVLQAAWEEQSKEPTLIDPEAQAAAIETLEPAAAPLPAAAPAPPTPAVALEPRSPPPRCDMDSEIAGPEGVGKVRVAGDFSEGAPPSGIAGGTASIEPIVDWPPEDSRRILALRLVAPPPDRFPGRALRLALAAEGFLLGRFAIFHKPDEANRAVLSAASLTHPGAFDLDTMDSQRYAGLSLFAVLPGPKTAPQAFEELLAAARNLNERLQGALQDERGGPLTALRVASIRESLKAEAATLPAAAAAHGA